MKTININIGSLKEPAGKHYSFNYEVMPKTEGDRGKKKERFDKNNLSEDDIDKIWAVV